MDQTERIRAVRAIIEDAQGRVLLLRRSAGTTGGGAWCLPGGGVDDGETPEQAIEREIEEETGLRCSDVESLFDQDSPPLEPGGDHYLNLYFRCSTTGDVALNDESSESTWVHPREASEMALQFRNGRALRKYWFQAALRGYSERRGDFERLAAYLKARIEQIVADLDIFPIISARAKSIEGFADKIHRKTYDDPLTQVTDLCGVRVITHTLDEVGRIAEAIEDEFVLDPVNSEDKGQKLAFTQFGYLSRHFVISVKEFKKVGLPMEDRDALASLLGLKAELQLRTLAQHLWADVYHELGYRNEFQFPARFEREFARIAALLEYCDRGFQDIKHGMRTYESSYSAHMSREDLEALAERFEIMLETCANESIAHRLIRAHLELGNRNRILEIDKEYQHLIEAHPPALRDIGVALCQEQEPASEDFRRGQSLLAGVVERDPRNVDAVCCLASTYEKAGDRKRAAEFYHRAHRVDPTDPYALGNYLFNEIVLKGDLGIVEYFHMHIDKAVARCRGQVDVGVNLPWAYFDLGFFELLRRQPIPAVHYYARGIDQATHMWMVRSARKPTATLRPTGMDLPGLDIIDTLLYLGAWIKAGRSEQSDVSNDPVWSIPANADAPLFGDDVFVLSGGCSGLDATARGYLVRLRDELRELKGTLVSGGTTSGIAGVAGELQEISGGDLKTVGYLPADLRDAKRDDRYRAFRETSGRDFSLLEPLLFWQDFFSRHGDPHRVKMVGFNGGRIAAGEYRIALAFGARVGVVQGSGRAADALLTDPLWRHHPGITILGTEPGSVQAFVSGRGRAARGDRG